jgi:hypothetical protein
VVVAQQDLELLFQYLSKDWLLYKAGGGRLELWEEGDSPDEIHNIWGSRSPGSSFQFKILVLEFAGSEWIYRREKTIKSRNILLKNEQGIPYLRPEIQLLYKGGSSHVRKKDYRDLQMFLPYLKAAEKDWLAASLLKQFPKGHPWLDYILRLFSDNNSEG